MKYFELKYWITPQGISFYGFPETMEGVASALRFARKRERMGYTVEPSSIVLKHKLEHLKNQEQ